MLACEHATTLSIIFAHGTLPPRFAVPPRSRVRVCVLRVGLLRHSQEIKINTYTPRIGHRKPDKHLRIVAQREHQRSLDRDRRFAAAAAARAASLAASAAIKDAGDAGDDQRCRGRSLRPFQQLVEGDAPHFVFARSVRFARRFFAGQGTFPDWCRGGRRR